MELFIKNLTSVDSAVLLPGCGPKGISWMVDVNWTGSLNRDDVVMDFSGAKQTAKQVIDAHIDHKLIVPQSLVNEYSSGNKIIYDRYGRNDEDFFAILTYDDSLFVIDDVAGTDGFKRTLEHKISELILSRSPDNVSSVSVKLIDREKTQGTFSYLHSLKNHPGNCQRFHGHRSFVHIDGTGCRNTEAENRIIELFNGKYVVNGSDLSKDPDNSELVQFIKRQEGITISNVHLVRYRGCQGAVSILIPRKQTVVLGNDPTIENMIWHTKDRYALGSETTVELYEGLEKGVTL